MGMRSISMLTEASDLNDEDLFGISKKNGDNYESNKLKYDTLCKQTSGIVKGNIVNDLNFGNVADVESQLFNPISSMISGEIELSGNISLNKTPSLTTEQNISDLSDNQFVTKKTVEQLSQKSSYIGSQSQINCNPQNSKGYTHDAGNLLKCHIEDSHRESTVITCNFTGTLVMYGWVASNADVNPEECWVGLFADIINGNGEQTTTAVAISPWIVGKYSQNLQYVGFSIPVVQGLELKVITGFNVNGTNSGFGTSNSLLINGAEAGGNQPNTFVGYIIHS